MQKFIKLQAIKQILAAYTLSCLLTGCASIVSGTSQKIMVETPPTTQATCSFKNDQGVWFLTSTPGSVIVHRSNASLLVNCKKKGYRESQQSIHSIAKNLVAGNLLFGGIVGTVVDMQDGAAFEYPSQIRVPMKK